MLMYADPGVTKRLWWHCRSISNSLRFKPVNHAWNSRESVPFGIWEAQKRLTAGCRSYADMHVEDAPKAPPEDIALYGFKRAADNMAELARQLSAPKIILGGHDW